jgi:ABC-type phosphate/phosphonate transport system ATPase subunit
MESSPHTSQDYPSNQRTIGAATYRHEARESDVYIAVMGVTGAGKSTFISHLTDSKVQVGDGLNACVPYSLISVSRSFRTDCQRYPTCGNVPMQTQWPSEHMARGYAGI